MPEDTCDLHEGLYADMDHRIQTISPAFGVTPVHLNRVHKELRLREATTLQWDSLFIDDPKKLVRIACFDENYPDRRFRVAA